MSQPPTYCCCCRCLLCVCALKVHFDCCVPPNWHFLLPFSSCVQQGQTRPRGAPETHETLQHQVQVTVYRETRDPKFSFFLFFRRWTHPAAFCCCLLSSLPNCVCGPRSLHAGKSVPDDLASRLDLIAVSSHTYACLSFT